ncbi:hypothetical protein PCO31111_00501 [Pandoraea communis]|uniref:Uncharacterized protein n=2 Tax=Pandoraea communis TaxID=2508297 RepID=A0A5E4S1X9_9BURK|nr:hypothetical protein PCO31111_00501 [Pandoraea communis]
MEGVVLRRGVEQVLIPDTNALLVIRVLQKAMCSVPRTPEEITDLFAAPVRPFVISLLDLLRAKRFVVAVNAQDRVKPEREAECPTDVFYWHFNLSQARVAKALNETCWAFVGINQLNQHLLQAMLDEGLENYVIVDDPMLRNVTFYDDDFQLTSEFWRNQHRHIVEEDRLIDGAGDSCGFVVAASEFGGAFLLERWNEYAVTHGVAFYPVLLENLVGYCGPLVIPTETACFACLQTRQNSNTSGFQEKRLMERHAFDAQHVAAYHRSMLQVLASVAQFDLVKFKSDIQWETGSLCEIDLLSGTMSRRKLLKAPRCPVCSALRNHPQTNIHKQLTSTEAWNEIRQLESYHEN